MVVNAKHRRKYKAVIFDLGGTLTYGHAWSEYVDAARKIAAAISAPEDDFVRLWFEQSEGLGTGTFPSYQDFIRHICDQLCLNTQDSVIKLATNISLSLAKKHLFVARDGAIEVLSCLKTNGYKIGLISDCAPDVPMLWNDTPFAPLIDVAVFSCTAGMNKSNLRIFRIALEKLAVKPENCIYIADGMKNELANAKKLGMHSVQILVPSEIDDSPIREDWHGPKIASLKEVLNLLK
jgi:putative hydrolase of the HAD superfamily